MSYKPAKGISVYQQDNVFSFFMSQTSSVSMTKETQRVECKGTAVCPLPMLLVKPLSHSEAEKGEKKKTVWLNIDRTRDIKVSDIQERKHSLKELSSVSTVRTSLRKWIK